MTHFTSSQYKRLVPLLAVAFLLGVWTNSMLSSTSPHARGRTSGAESAVNLSLLYHRYRQLVGHLGGSTRTEAGATTGAVGKGAPASTTALATTKAKSSTAPDALATTTAGTRQPVRKFVYHALHKTGSEHTRMKLRRYCRDHRLTCLTYKACNMTTGWYCMKGVSERMKAQHEVEYGSFTVTRMTHGCCAMFTNFTHDEIVDDLDAIVEHYPLFVPENQQLLHKWYERHRPFRFTIVRDPIEQFISYHRQMATFKHEVQDAPNLTTTVDLFYKAHSQQNAFLPESVRKLHWFLSNSQSKELGWDGRTDASLNATLAYVRRLDFVCLSAEMGRCWAELERATGWPHAYWQGKTAAGTWSARVKGSKLAEGYVQKLKEILWADYMLYAEATSWYKAYIAKSAYF